MQCCNGHTIKSSLEVKHFENIRKLSNYYDADLKHPLIDIRKYENVKNQDSIIKEPIVCDFYKISLVKNFNGYIQIGNTKFEDHNGILHFVEPGQIYTCNSTNPWKGFQVLIHPDIFQKHFSHKEINTYDFFSYEVNESLLLTEQEKKLVENIMAMAWREFNNGKDTFSIPIVLSYLSTLLNLTERFYARQFDTRKKWCNQLLSDFFSLLKTHYANRNEPIQQPTVSYFAHKLYVTPNYLSAIIRHHTGKTALTVIQDFVIEQAKRQLSNSTQTVSEISFNLGFEYPNYFSRLFRRKTNLSPTQYRKSVKSI